MEYLKSLDLQIARACHDIRVKEHITKKEFASWCGLTTKTIDEFEKGIKSIPTKVLSYYLQLSLKIKL